MTSGSKRALLALTMASFALSACKATKEDELKAWSANSAAVTSLSSAYPQFATLLRTRLANQQKPFDAAKAKDGKDAIEAMGLANRSVRALVSPLQTYESKRKRILKLYNDHSVLKNKGHKVRDAREKANKKLQQAAEVIAAAKPTNEADMLRALSDANGYLAQGLEPLERLKSKGNSKKKKKKKKKDK